jgi:hypothetical protein
MDARTHTQLSVPTQWRPRPLFTPHLSCVNCDKLSGMDPDSELRDIWIVLHYTQDIHR